MKRCIAFLPVLVIFAFSAARAEEPEVISIIGHHDETEIPASEIPPNTVIKYFTIKGNNSEELRDEIRSHGPKMGDDTKWAYADCHYHFGWNAEYIRTNGIYHWTKIVITCQNTVNLPKWKNMDRKNMVLMHWWKGIITIFKEHEFTHARINNSGGADMEAALNSMSARSGAQLCAHADSAFKQISGQVRIQNKQFDADSVDPWYK